MVHQIGHTNVCASGGFPQVVTPRGPQKCSLKGGRAVHMAIALRRSPKGFPKLAFHQAGSYKRFPRRVSPKCVPPRGFLLGGPHITMGIPASRSPKGFPKQGLLRGFCQLGSVKGVPLGVVL